MANNRMYIHEKRTQKTIVLCKYYPDSRWRMYHSTAALDEWLKDVTDEAVYEHGGNINHGPTSFELVYEHAEEGSGAKEI
jgi:hypothetical protein